MAYYFDKEKRIKKEIDCVKKIGPYYKIQFKNKCECCGRKEVMVFCPKLQKNPLLLKAIKAYAGEKYKDALDFNRFMYLNTSKNKRLNIIYSYYDKDKLTNKNVRYDDLIRLLELDEVNYVFNNK